MSVGPASLLTEWSRLLLGSLCDAGIEDAVLSPGSRLTPFVHAAVRHPRLRCHEAIDERAAAFFALGQARATGRPSLLICTSGTAAAHYMPAVVEAGAAYVPLLVMTADRPLEAYDCAAPQTIDQVKLFGDHARAFYELGAPEATPSALAALRRRAVQAVHATLFPRPGAVHLNARASKPLEPANPATDAERALAARVDRLLSTPPARAHVGSFVPDEDVIAAVARRVRSAERGIVVCGPAPIAQADARAAIFELAASLGWPLFCEAASQLRFAEIPDGVVVCDAFDGLLRSRSFANEVAPDVILQIGAPPVSSAFERLLARRTAGLDHIVVAPHGWNDPTSTATELIFADVGITAQRLAAALGKGRPAPSTAAVREWADGFQRANREAWRAVDEELGDGDAALTEGSAVRALVAGLPRGTILSLGNSLPIREVETFCRAGSFDGLVLCQRGANGIDGLVAGAAGTASVYGRPIVLLLGDVSLLHDATSLALTRAARVPLVVVVINNGGGRIFEQLPIAEAPLVGDDVRRYVLTPHGFHFEHAAALFGLPYHRAQTRPDLERALTSSLATRGGSLVEITVPAHGAREEIRRLSKRIDEALGELPRAAAPATAPGGAPLVLLHGFTGSPDDWREVRSLLPPSRRFIAPFLHGHDDSRPTSAGLSASFEQEVDRLAAFVRAAGITKAHVVGYSMGARVALGMLVRHPDLVAEATLVGVNPGLGADERRVRAAEDDRWADLAERSVEAFVDAWEEHPVLASQRQLPLSLREAQRTRRLRHDGAALASAMRVLGLSRMPDFRSALAGVAARVHLVTGEHDVKHVRIAEEMRGTLRRCTVTVAPGTGHNVVMEAPAFVAGLLEGG